MGKPEYNNFCWSDLNHPHMFCRTDLNYPRWGNSDQLNNTFGIFAKNFFNTLLFLDSFVNG